MDSSSFDNDINNPFVFTDIEPIWSNGATSDTYKVLIYGKWHFLKRPKKIYADNPLYLSAFQKEFEIGYTLDHPNIVRYIIKGEDENSLYILTDFVDGFTLTEFIKLNPNYFNVPKHLDKFITQLLSALKYLHERQILHLDLKPDNIIITGVNNDVKLVDFGFSYTDCFSSLAIGKTELYAAPEQLNKEGIDQRTDVYGLGKILEYIFYESDSKISKTHRRLINRCLLESKERRFNDINEIQGYLKDKSQSKKKYIYFAISLCTLVAVISFYQFTSQHDKSSDIHPIYETMTHKIDTIYMVDTVKQKESRTNIIIDKYTPLKRDIRIHVENNFKNLYSTYDSLDIDNISSALSEFQKGYNESLLLTELLSIQYKNIPSDEIGELVSKEIDKKASLFRSMVAKYEKGQKRMVKNESN